MITVHHLERSRSHRIIWLCEELGADYQIKRYERDPITSLAPAALQAVHPTGKAPLIDDDGFVVAETGAITDYLTDKYDGALVPAPGTENFHSYRYWLHAAEGSFAPTMVMALLLGRMEEAAPFFVKPVAKRLAQGLRDGYLTNTTKVLFDHAEASLGKSEWLTGNTLTAADVIMSFPFQAVAIRGDLSAYPNIASFLKRSQERPAYQRALEVAGENSLLG